MITIVMCSFPSKSPHSRRFKRVPSASRLAARSVDYELVAVIAYIHLCQAVCDVLKPYGSVDLDTNAHTTDAVADPDVYYSSCSIAPTTSSFR